MANRKLQSEIDRTLKKIQEGVSLFDDLLEKFLSAENQALKDKTEIEMKKEIKKLQRYREQVKSWASGNETKTKEPLYEARRLIETKMERFKQIEREAKTKPFSKKGLGFDLRNRRLSAERQQQHDDVLEFIEQSIDTLEQQLEEYETEIETISTTSKRRGGKENSNRLNDLREYVADHIYHKKKLEEIRTFVNEGTFNFKQAENLKDVLNNYIEFHTEDDFYDDKLAYEEICEQQFEESEDSSGRSPSESRDDEEDEKERESDKRKEQERMLAEEKEKEEIERKRKELERQLKKEKEEQERQLKKEKEEREWRQREEAEKREREEKERERKMREDRERERSKVITHTAPNQKMQIKQTSNGLQIVKMTTTSPVDNDQKKADALRADNRNKHYDQSKEHFTQHHHKALSYDNSSSSMSSPPNSTSPVLVSQTISATTANTVQTKQSNVIKSNMESEIEFTFPQLGNEIALYSQSSIINPDFLADSFHALPKETNPFSFDILFSLDEEPAKTILPSSFPTETLFLNNSLVHDIESNTMYQGTFGQFVNNDFIFLDFDTLMFIFYYQPGTPQHSFTVSELHRRGWEYDRTTHLWCAHVPGTPFASTAEAKHGVFLRFLPSQWGITRDVLSLELKNLE